MKVLQCKVYYYRFHNVSSKVSLQLIKGALFWQILLFIVIIGERWVVGVINSFCILEEID